MGIISGGRETCRGIAGSNHMTREDVENHRRGTLVTASRKRHPPENKPVILSVLTM